MNLTTEQREEIERQRQGDPGRRSFRITFTPEQRDEYRRAVAEELASRQENLEQVRKFDDAEDARR